MKKYFHIIFLIILAMVVFLGAYYWDVVRGIMPVLREPSGNIEELINKGESPLTMPPSFSISVFANVPGARVIVFDEKGDLWVSQTQLGQVTHIKVEEDKAAGQEIAWSGLNKPHGLAFDPKNSGVLYVAEEHRVSRVNLSAKEKVLEEVLTLPEGEGHSTRTVGFGPDGRLYVSTGSSCNVCDETEDWRATILSIGESAADLRIFARGLRNAVFFIWHPFTKELWATEMGRDLLGDDTPPDEVNIVRDGKFYGWPRCYGKNTHDTKFDTNTYIRNPCIEPFETPSHIDIPAHSAPLGLAFVEPSFGWPEEYWNDLIIAYHGSWNRTVPTGYKLVRVKLDEKGEPPPGGVVIEDFITGWLRGKNSFYEALGRPVGLVFGPDRALYISDDKAGLIYKFWY